METKKDTGLNRRIAVRVKCDLLGVCILSNNLVYNIRCFDISVDGLGFSIPIPLSYGSHVFIEIISLNLGKLLFRGRVRWCKKIDNQWRCGIYFDNPLTYNPHKIAANQKKITLEQGLSIYLEKFHYAIKQFKNSVFPRNGKNRETRD
ncbi:MAG: PilZ domain-containing protein [Candidatus Omnitrophica bacterium]|nr:PilZ domain-containing protein [Candidatus Omnitrophota bacterium]